MTNINIVALEIGHLEAGLASGWLVVALVGNKTLSPAVKREVLQVLVDTGVWV